MEHRDKQSFIPIWTALVLSILFTLPNYCYSSDSTEKLNLQLREAAAVDDTEEVQRLLKLGAEVDGSNKFGVTPLMRAVQSGGWETTALLLANGADVNARTTAGCSALTMAAEFNHEPISAMLVEMGADVSNKTRSGWDALLIAARLGNDIL